MVKRFTGSGRQKEGGFLATHKQDFNAHITGEDWRHKADNIDVDPISGASGDDVQEVLESLADGFSNLGYVQIGSGYDSCTGDFADAFNAAFASSQLANGGTVLVKSGSYCMQSTVIVPAGIRILGESIGSVFINGEMSETPMFQFQSGTQKTNVETGTPTAQTLQFEDSNRIQNVTLYDNRFGAVASGDPSMSAVPMVQCRHGANLTIDSCAVIGKVVNPVSGTSDVTDMGVGFTGLTTLGVGTNVNILNTYFDGVKTAIDFDARQGELDYLTVRNCIARTYGDGTGSSGRFLSMVNCNANISENEHIGVYTEGSDVFIEIKDIVASGDLSMTINGNSGGPDSGSGTFLSDLRSSPLYIKMSGVNSWGDPDDVHGFGRANDLSSNGDSEVTSSDSTEAKGIVHHTFAHRYMRDVTAISKVYAVDVRNSDHSPGTAGSGFGILHITTNPLAGTSLTVTVDAVLGSIPLGGVFEVIVENETGADITMSWGSDFKFASVGDDQIGLNNEVSGALSRWKGTAVIDSADDRIYLMERSDYIL